MISKDIPNTYHCVFIFPQDIFNIQPQQDTVSSSQQTSKTIEQHQLNEQIYDEPCTSTKKNSKRKKFILQSSSSSNDESEQSFQTSKTRKKKRSGQRPKSPMAWEAGYKKLICCKLCSSVWGNKRSFLNHSRMHELVRQKYKNILKRQCSVNLIKIDDEPNITGLSNVVVHSSAKIVESGKSDFYTIYSKDVANIDAKRSKSLQNEDKNKCFSQESSDGEEVNGFKPTNRKTRLISRSSNETVVLGSKSNKLISDEEDSKGTIQNTIDDPLNNNQCINIDDSSDSESEQDKVEKSKKAKQPIEAQSSDYKTIEGIISMCFSSYHMKNESTEVDTSFMNVNQKKKAHLNTESQLKHKVLSIGRKTINKQGFNCTGLLRYMEHKSLTIEWIPTAQSVRSKDNNYIRILTKLRGDLNLDDDPGWVNISATPRPQPNAVLLNNSISIAAPTKSLSKVPESNDSTAGNVGTSMPPNIKTSQVEQIDYEAKLDEIPALLSYLDSKAGTSDSKKLLNANPVANPKQLPKKLGVGNESRHNKTVAQQSICQTTNDDNIFNPIITSTTSLAFIPSNEQVQDTNVKNSIASEEVGRTETTVPRIKVKPVSELMSKRTLGIMKEQTTTNPNSNIFVSHLWPHQIPANNFVPNIAPQMLVPSPPLQMLQMPTLTANAPYQPMTGQMTSHTKKEYVILDTTDFPNTKTDSPIKYVKDLLQLHNIFLLDPNETVPSNFICLIKFKVVFKQDSQKDSVVLCLSLSCFKNTFSFQVRDRNQEIIDMTKISANWQWEILQIYQGDVSNKVLQTARKFSQETYDLTYNFFCLLKAINFRKPIET